MKGQSAGTDIDSLKFTTQNLSQELLEMKKMLTEMHQSASEKDSEIIKLNMNLAGEKKKAQEVLRASRSKLLASQSSKSHSQDTRNRFENRLNIHGSPSYDFENTTAILGMADDNFIAT